MPFNLIWSVGAVMWVWRVYVWKGVGGRMREGEGVCGRVWDERVLILFIHVL